MPHQTTECFSENDRVSYLPYPYAETEWGTVTEIRDEYIFVLFDGDKQPKAVKPWQITLVEKS